MGGLMKQIRYTPASNERSPGTRPAGMTTRKANARSRSFAALRMTISWVMKQIPYGNDSQKGKSKGGRAQRDTPPFRKSAKGWATRGLMLLGQDFDRNGGSFLLS